MSGATTGKFGIYESDEKAYQNQRVGNLIPHSVVNLNKRFIFYLLYSLKRSIEKDAYGGAQPNISPSKIEALNTLLPPLPIQRAIVAKIEALFSDLDNGIADLKKAQERLKVYRQAVLKKAFEGELTKEWREKQTDLPTAKELLEQIKQERQKHYEQQLEEWKKAVREWEKNEKEGKKPGKPTALKEFNADDVENSAMGKLPLGYAWVLFGNIMADSPQNGLYKPSTMYGSGTDIVRIDNFYEGVLNILDGLKKVKLEQDDLERYKIEKDQILINRVNSIEYLGKTGLVKELKVPTVFESNIMKVSIVKEWVLSSYIVHYLTSGLGIMEIRKNAKHAVNQASINQTDVSLTNIPLCSLPEQHQIVREIESRLSVCDKVEQNITEALEKSETLRQSILKKAFEGKLLSAEEIAKCKKEADYEPASELLKKIKMEKK